jgi:hypothetical protein
MTMGYGFGDVHADDATIQAHFCGSANARGAQLQTARGNMSSTETAIGSSRVQH